MTQFYNFPLWLWLDSFRPSRALNAAAPFPPIKHFIKFYRRWTRLTRCAAESERLQQSFHALCNVCHDNERFETWKWNEEKNLCRYEQHSATMFNMKAHKLWFDKLFPAFPINSPVQWAIVCLFELLFMNSTAKILISNSFCVCCRLRLSHRRHHRASTGASVCLLLGKSKVFPALEWISSNVCTHSWLPEQERRFCDSNLWKLYGCRARVWGKGGGGDFNWKLKNTKCTKCLDECAV